MSDTMYRVVCDKHDVDHNVETAQAASKHVNVHREVHAGCENVSYEEVEG